MNRTTQPTIHDAAADTPLDGSLDAAAGRFEPCASHRGADADGPCTGCGWLASEHTTVATGLAVVIEVATAAPALPLRRAS